MSWQGLMMTTFFLMTISWRIERVCLCAVSTIFMGGRYEFWDVRDDKQNHVSI